MSFFSRLSDIISCKIDDLLANTNEPATAIGRVIAEIEEGLAGARRSAAAAAASEERLRADLAERSVQVQFWAGNAREELAAGNESGARQSLMRKRETEDLVAGLDQQLAAANSTREHLSTTMRAIEARLAEARRRQEELAISISPVRVTKTASQKSEDSPPSLDGARAAQIEADLEALRRELQQ
ncbi:MAG: PspA/IM30 family protein [Planctomycetales bacterium]